MVLQTCDGVETKDFPLGTTALQLWRQLGLGAQPGFALTVNSRLPAGEATLQSGDLVQVCGQRGEGHRDECWGWLRLRAQLIGAGSFGAARVSCALTSARHSAPR